MIQRAWLIHSICFYLSDIRPKNCWTTSRAKSTNSNFWILLTTNVNVTLTKRDLVNEIQINCFNFLLVLTKQAIACLYVFPQTKANGRYSTLFQKSNLLREGTLFWQIQFNIIIIQHSTFNILHSNWYWYQVHAYTVQEEEEGTYRLD